MLEDDIVKALRNAETSIKDYDGNVRLVNHIAADTIEQLREILQKIVPAILKWEQVHIDENGKHHVSTITQDIADDVQRIINTSFQQRMGK